MISPLIFLSIDQIGRTILAEKDSEVTWSDPLLRVEPFWNRIPMALHSQVFSMSKDADFISPMGKWG